MNDGSKLGTTEAVKAVDMQNTRTPYPQISNLAEGMYRFQLKVYDVAGQFSTAQVDVFVRRPATSEPRGLVFLSCSFSLRSRCVKEYRNYSAIELGPIGWIEVKGR
uniref:Uncharacterized protein n=1 Tax=Daphnia galeata TaxID=27404 RepID=A0A8J2W490_9CRUS|nr:unnamed protein product [Daphnia galeata]